VLVSGEVMEPSAKGRLEPGLATPPDGSMTSDPSIGAKGAKARGTATLSSALRVFDLSLGEMIWSRRSAFLALLVGAPVSLAAIIRIVALAATDVSFRANGRGINGATVFGVMVWLLYVRFIVPILG